MNCSNCGENLVPGTNSCPKCGTTVDNQIVDTNSQTVSFYQTMQSADVAPIEFVNNVDLGSNDDVEVLDENFQDTGVAQPVMNQVPMGFPQVSPIPIQQQPAPQPVIGGIRPSQHNKTKEKSKKVWVFILIILLIIGVGIGGYFIYDNIQDKKADENKEQNKNQNNEVKEENKENTETKEEATTSNGVVIKDTKKISNGSLLLLVENTSSKTVGVDIEFDFLNEAMKLLGSLRTHVALAPNSERYVLVTDNVLKEEYASMETRMSVFDYANLIKIENIASSNITKTELENKWLLQYQNFTKNVMEFETVVLFYQNNEIVYVASGLATNVTDGNKASIELDLLSLNDIQYTMYEVYGYAQYDIG